MNQGLINWETNGRVTRGDVFYAKTNAELLNQLFNKGYKSWMKSTYQLDKDFCLIMHVFNKDLAGWINRELEDGDIIEEFVREEVLYESHAILPVKYRAIFEKRKSDGIFIFKGVYKLDERSTAVKRYWKRISNESNLINY